MVEEGIAPSYNAQSRDSVLTTEVSIEFRDTCIANRLSFILQNSLGEVK